MLCSRVKGVVELDNVKALDEIKNLVNEILSVINMNKFRVNKPLSDFNNDKI